MPLNGCFWEYSFMPNFRGGGGGGVSNCKFFGKIPQVYLIIIRKWPKNTPPPNLRNLDNFPPWCILFDPPPYNLAQKSTLKNSSSAAFWKIGPLKFRKAHFPTLPFQSKGSHFYDWSSFPAEGANLTFWQCMTIVFCFSNIVMYFI